MPCSLRSAAMLLVAASFIPSFAAHASTLVVPDDVATIQGALDLEPDTVRVRAGNYPERPVIGRDIALIGEGAIPPRLDGLQILLLVEQSSIIVEGLHFTGLVFLSTYDETTEIFAFRRCRFDSSLAQSVSDVADVSSLSFEDCDIVGMLEVQAAERFDFLSNRIDGELRFRGEVATVTIRGNVFRSPAWSGPFGPTGVHVVGGGTIRTSILRDNRFEGYGVGAQMFADSQEVADNHVLDCTEFGLRLVGDEAMVVTDNTVLRCGVGMVVYGVGRTVIERNVVGRSTMDGIQTDSQRLAMRHNTSYLNGGSGFVLLSGAGADSIRVDHNIGYGNGAYGVDATLGNPPPLACNDWFGNVAGAVSGSGPGVSDVSLDPLFCDVLNDSVGLSEKSPLMNLVGCGLIGARGVACATTPALVTLLLAEPGAGFVDLRWDLARGAVEAWFERADSEHGPWRRIVTERRRAGETAIDRDAGVEPGRTYFYRLAWIEEDGAVSRSQPIVVTLAIPGVTFALERIAPNPAARNTEISFVLPREAWVELDVLDLQGRVRTTLARGLHPAGTHRVPWTLRTGEGAVPAGIYFVRFRHPGGAKSRRLVVTR